MGTAKEKIDEKKLRSWKLLDNFRSRLSKLRLEIPPPPKKRPGGPERLLLEEDYFSLMLFGMLNPVLDTMRGLCAASQLERVQKEVCNRKVSLGSFSEAQGVFDPELLKGVFLDLAAENQTSWGDARLSQLADKLKLADGTLLPALLSMHWALSNGLCGTRRGYRVTGTRKISQVRSNGKLRAQLLPGFVVPR